MGRMKARYQEELEAGDQDDGLEPDGPDVPQELLNAEKRNYDNPFVRSCRKFYDTRGFLSLKQLEALDRVKYPSRRAVYVYFDPYDFS